MKQFFTLLFIVGIAAATSAQTVLKVPFGGVGVLNDAIEGDTMADGSRVDINRIYELDRGVPYLLSSSIQFSDYNLHIRAAPGDGARPIILQAVGDGGSPFSQMFRVRGDGNLTLEGLHISGETSLGSFNSRGFRISAEKCLVIMDDCVVERFNQSAFRLEADSIVLRVSNTICQRIGNTTDPNNGRFIDNRGVELDSIILENNLIYNMAGFFYRGGGGTLNTGYMNKNTFWFAGRSGFAFAEIDDLTFMNNIVTSGFAFGRTDSAQIQSPEYWIDIDTFIPDQNNWMIANNNFFSDSEITAAQPATRYDGANMVYLDGEYFSPAVQMAIDAAGTGASNITEEVDFFDKPVVNETIIDLVASDTLEGDIPNVPDWDMSDLTPDPAYSAIVDDPQIDRYVDYHDLCYDGVEFDSGTGGSDGAAIGAQVNCRTTTSVRDLFVDHNVSIYPNPTVDVLYINNLDNETIDRVRVIDIMGQERFNRVVNNTQTSIDVAGLASGHYFVTIENRDGTMSTTKFVKN